MITRQPSNVRHSVVHAQLLRQSPVPATDPRSPAFAAIERGFELEEGHERPLNPHALAVVGPVCRWALRHGLADQLGVVERAIERARFNLLAGFGHPRSDYEGFLLTAKWCTWLFFQDDWLCDGHVDGGVLGPAELAEAHAVLLAALTGPLPADPDPLASSIHDIGQQILARRGPVHLERFAAEVRDYFWGNEWEALHRRRGEIPSVSAFSKMRPYAGAAYTAFQFWEIVEDFDLGDARESVAARELRLLANNCISWANDLYSLRKEIHEGNPNNLVLALANERGEGLEAAMHTTVELYNREYQAFCQLVADLPVLGLGHGPRDLRPYADRLHGWILGNIRWSRLTFRYKEELTMKSVSDARSCG